MALSVLFGSVCGGIGIGGSVATVGAVTVVVVLLMSGIAVPRISKAAAAIAAGKASPNDLWYSIAFWRMSVSAVAMGAIGAVGGAVVDATA